jgi:hypothetical protein
MSGVASFEELQAISSNLANLHTDLVTNGIIVAALPPDVACTETNSEDIKTGVDLLHTDVLSTGISVSSLPSVTCTETDTGAIKIGLDLLHTDVSASGIKFAMFPSITPDQLGVQVFGTSSGSGNVQLKTDADGQIIFSNPGGGGDISAANQLTKITYLTNIANKVNTLYSFVQYFQPSLSYTYAATYQQNKDTLALAPLVNGLFGTYTISPALPAGVSISSTTGVISGMPTVEVASQTYTVQAFCNGVPFTTTLTFAILKTSTYYLLVTNTLSGGYINGYEIEALDIDNKKVNLLNGVQAYSTVTFPNQTDGNYTTFYTSPGANAGASPWVYYSFVAPANLIKRIKFYVQNNSRIGGHRWMLFNDTFNRPLTNVGYKDSINGIGMLWKAECTDKEVTGARTVICNIPVTSSQTIVTDTTTWTVTVF